MCLRRVGTLFAKQEFKEVVLDSLHRRHIHNQGKSRKSHQNNQSALILRCNMNLFSREIIVCDFRELLCLYKFFKCKTLCAI